MDLRVLEYFLMVADEGNITHASELLHVSQPTVSRQLMELERELGKTLFIRTRKNVSLTQQGMLFRETAKEMLALYQKATQEDTGSETLVGDIYLGMGETSSVDFLMKQIARFREQHPRVSFHLMSENADRICDDIEKGLLDIGFAMQKANPVAFEMLELGLHESWGVLVPKDHPLAGETAVSGRQLRRERLILPESLAFKSELLRLLGIDSKERVGNTYNLFYNAFVLAKASGELIVCLGTLGERQPGWRFIPFAKRKEASASLVWKKRPVQSPAMEAFLEHIRHAISE